MSRPTTPLPQPPTQASTATFASPPRSSTHPVKPRHHIPHHPHRTHHHRHHDVSVPQSAIQPTTSVPFSDVISRTTAKAIDGSKPPSLEQQQQQQQQLQTELAKEQAAKDEVDREQAKWVEVEKKRAKRKAVDDTLLLTLTNLSSLSTSTTRRLDYTYYSLLSSISSLHTTLSALHTLSLSLSTYTSTFISETTLLTTDLSSQITHQTFEAQARRIGGLEERMRKGRERKEDLSGSVTTSAASRGSSVDAEATLRLFDEL
ncbi:hypothetical protein JMJ35_006458 [Cladonia borealis]|uniref:Uncharacterized protein n=1 Tax=Cladonia borealis TaxID=184061 RepID=A0AA39QZZ0_9LECA|nr:hypothetical protein JMJ35_006458 [Cladonia borealis]